MICVHGGGAGWARIGYAAITALPPLGLLMADAAAGRKSGRAGVMLGAGVLLFTMITPISPVCRGNYAIFEMDGRFGAAHGAWYLGVLGLTVWRLYRYFGQTKAKAKRAQLSWLLAGYASFLFPTAAVVVAAPQVYGGTPSIMCGFALIYAAILTFKVLPRA